MSYTKEDIIRIVREENIDFIRLQFTDIFGQLKNVAITASQIEKAVNNLMSLTSIFIPIWTPSPFCPGVPPMARWPG